MPEKWWDIGTIIDGHHEVGRDGVIFLMNPLFEDAHLGFLFTGGGVA